MNSQDLEVIPEGTDWSLIFVQFFGSSELWRVVTLSSACEEFTEKAEEVIFLSCAVIISRIFITFLIIFFIAFIIIGMIRLFWCWRGRRWTEMMIWTTRWGHTIRLISLILLRIFWHDGHRWYQSFSPYLDLILMISILFNKRLIFPDFSSLISILYP